MLIDQRYLKMTFILLGTDCIIGVIPIILEQNMEIF